MFLVVPLGLGEKKEKQKAKGKENGVSNGSTSHTSDSDIPRSRRTKTTALLREKLSEEDSDSDIGQAKRQA